MHQLAAEMGAAPTLAALARSPKALVAWSLGQAYVTFFRLVGPFAGEEHWKVASGELYRPVATRDSGEWHLPVTMGAFSAVNLAGGGGRAAARGGGEGCGGGFGRVTDRLSRQYF